MSTDEINERMGGRTEEVYIEDFATGEMKSKIVELEADKTELNGILFNDIWYFDEKNFKLTKVVKAYCPIRRYFRDNDLDDELRYRKIAYFIYDNYKSTKEKLESESRMKLFKKLKYEFFLDNTEYAHLDLEGLGLYDIHFEKSNSPFWTSYAKNKFRYIIIDRVLTGQSAAYDFTSGEKLQVKQVLKNLGEREDSLMLEDPETYEFIVKVIKSPFNIMEIKSGIFIENWYVDQQTMRIKKEIVGVAPVRWYYPVDYFGEEAEALRKEIAFVVYFDKQKTNNYDIKYISESVPLDSVALKPGRDLFNNHAYYQFEDTDINFKELFIQHINKNKIKLYFADYEDNDFAEYRKENYKQVDKSLILERIGIKNDTIFDINPEGVKYEKVVQTKAYGTDSIATIFSREIWKFDAKNFKFYKNVFAYAPSIKFYREDGGDAKYRLISYILNSESLNEFSEKVPRKMKLFKKIKYEFGYDIEKMRKTDIPEYEKERPLFWNNYNNKKFKEIIFDKIVNKKLDVYSFDTMKRLSSAEIDTLMIKGTVIDINPDTGENIYVQEKFKIEEFKSFIFYENWYVNPKTLQIHKQVLGVAPVFYTKLLKEDKEEIEKRVPFLVYFNEEKLH